jgi:putative Mg2+ transporter-C (MgtC) family protein
MSFLNDLLQQTELDGPTMILRLLISVILGGVIGWEREGRRQSAGLRTHILICLGSTLLMLISIFIPQTFKNFQNGDPGRIAAQVVSGIGFLGAGAIFRLGATIKGLTTAATIWVAAAIGLAVGAGVYLAALVGTVLILFVLVGLEKVEKRYFPSHSLKVLQLRFQGTKITTDLVFMILDKFSIKTHSINIVQSLDKKRFKLKLIVHIPNDIELKKLYKELNSIDNVSEITLGQDF